MGKELVKILKALADENRIRIIEILSGSKTCVCHIESALKMTQSNVSRHLIKLREAGLIEGEKKGQFAFYQLNQVLIKKYPFLLNLISELKSSSHNTSKIKECP